MAKGKGKKNRQRTMVIHAAQWITGLLAAVSWLGPSYDGANQGAVGNLLQQGVPLGTRIANSLYALKEATPIAGKDGSFAGNRAGVGIGTAGFVVVKEGGKALGTNRSMIKLGRVSVAAT